MAMPVSLLLIIGLTGFAVVALVIVLFMGGRKD
jgi:hypothetical protein